MVPPVGVERSIYDVCGNHEAASLTLTTKKLRRRSAEIDKSRRFVPPALCWTRSSGRYRRFPHSPSRSPFKFNRPGECCICRQHDRTPGARSIDPTLNVPGPHSLIHAAPGYARKHLQIGRRRQDRPAVDGKDPRPASAEGERPADFDELHRRRRSNYSAWNCPVDPGALPRRQISVAAVMTELVPTKVPPPLLPAAIPVPAASVPPDMV